MPEKEMGSHPREHVMVPARVLADFIVVHTAFGFRFLKALFNGPPYATEPDKQAERGTHRGVAERVPGPRMGPKRPLDVQPRRRRGMPLIAEPAPFASELVRDGAFGP